MPTIEELTKMVEEAGGDPQKLAEVTRLFLTELSGAQTALHNANKEAADRRKKLEAYEKAEAEKNEAEKSELEKAQARAAELEKKLADQTEQSKKDKIRHAVEITAKDLGYADPEDAIALADLSGVVVDDAGKVSGVEQALKTLLEKKPHLKGSGQTQPPDLDANRRGQDKPVTVEDLIARKRADYTSI